MSRRKLDYMDGEDGATPAKTKKTGLTFMGYKDTKGTTTRFLFLVRFEPEPELELFK